MTLEEIPNYRNGTNEEKCDNCFFLKYSGSSNQEFNRSNGWCSKYRAHVQRFRVCDSWKEKAKKKYRVYR